ncbi:hypothetical protein ACIPRL_08165 [Streptomyces sp. NPDC090085]|uniref:hypothetical protein n=1 Tax=Streptomyces sp. NPDC090085 TaxID=3365943 RepID=UPI0037F42240
MPQRSNTFDQHTAQAVALTRPSRSAGTAPRYREALDRGPRVAGAADRHVTAMRGER